MRSGAPYDRKDIDLLEYPVDFYPQNPYGTQYTIALLPYIIDSAVYYHGDCDTQYTVYSLLEHGISFLLNRLYRNDSQRLRNCFLPLLLNYNYSRSYVKYDNQDNFHPELKDARLRLLLRP